MINQSAANNSQDDYLKKEKEGEKLKAEQEIEESLPLVEVGEELKPPEIPPPQVEKPEISEAERILELEKIRKELKPIKEARPKETIEEVSSYKKLPSYQKLDNLLDQLHQVGQGIPNHHADLKQKTKQIASEIRKTLIKLVEELCGLKDLAAEQEGESEIKSKVQKIKIQ